MRINIYVILYPGEVLYDIDIVIITFVIFEKYSIKKSDLVLAKVVKY